MGSSIIEKVVSTVTDIDSIKLYMDSLTQYVNQRCSHLESVEIILYTIIITSTVIWLKNKLFCNEINELSYKQWFLLKVRRLPVLKQYVEKQMEKTVSDVEKEFQKGLENTQYLQKLPQTGWPKEKILKQIDEYLKIGNYSWVDGYVSGAVYHGKDEMLKSLVKDVYGKTAYHNPLHPDVFPGIRIMETEIIRMACSLFHGDDESCGTVTTGGTESIFLACKAYREYARFTKGIKHPNMVIPVTAHAAFDKAAHLLKIKVKHVRICPETSKVDVKALKRSVDKNTIMIVGSAPAFPHGSIDPIEDIAKIGSKYNVPVHVDACLGGFLVAFMQEAGFQIRSFDFLVSGVTSISADTHKYAYAPKGTSVVLYRKKIYRHYQYTVQPDWPGGIYGTPSLSGSRSGGLIATCWSSMVYHGTDYYIEATKEIISVTRFIAEKLRSIPEIYLLGVPDVSVIAVGSKTFDIYRLNGALSDKGWNLNVLQFPPGFHFCVTLQHTVESVAERFVTDVQDCVSHIMKNPEVKAGGTAAVYGMSQQIPDRSLVSELVWAFLDACTSSVTPSKKIKQT